MIQSNTRENVQKMQSYGFKLTPVIKGGEDDKKPKLKNYKWSSDWTVEELVQAERIGVIHKDSNIFDLDFDDKSYVAHKFIDLLPETFTVGKLVNNIPIATHKIYKASDGKTAYKYSYPKNVKKGQTIIELLPSTQTIIAGVDRIILNNRAPTIQDPSRMTLIARLIATFSELYNHWAAEGQRDEAYLRLAGALAHTDVPLDLKTKFVERLCELTGDREIKKRVDKLARQEEALKEKPEVVYSVKGLSDFLGINLKAFDEIKPEEIKKVKEDDGSLGTEYIPHLPLIDGSLLLNREYPKPVMILDPILRDRTISQFSGGYGAGKTHFGLSIALSVANGRSFLEYKVKNARPVLYVEAELPGDDLQDRIQSLNYAHLDTDKLNDAERIDRSLRPENQYTCCQDDMVLAGYKFGFPDIANASDEERAVLGRQVIERTAEKIKDVRGKYPVLFLDNISALTAIDENKADHWSTLMKWCIRMKNKGITIVLFHHTGKTTGTASGSNMSQRLIDTHIILRKLDDKHRFEIPGKSVQCSVHFDKYRNFGGSNVLPYMLTCNEDGVWKKYPMLDQKDFALMEALNEGKTIKEIIKEKIMGQSTIYRRKKVLEDSGLLKINVKEEKNETGK